MPTLLDRIRMEMSLEELDSGDSFEPDVGVEPGDHVVGEADPDLQRLYNLIIRWGAAVDEGVAEIGKAPDWEKQWLCKRKARELQKKHKLLLEIFWASIRDTFCLWDKPFVNVRRGWQIVWRDSPDTASR